jgi:hypothetical protein
MSVQFCLADLVKKVEYSSSIEIKTKPRCCFSTNMSSTSAFEYPAASSSEDTDVSTVMMEEPSVFTSRGRAQTGACLRSSEVSTVWCGKSLNAVNALKAKLPAPAVLVSYMNAYAVKVIKKNLSSTPGTMSANFANHGYSMADLLRFVNSQRVVGAGQGNLNMLEWSDRMSNIKAAKSMASGWNASN